MPYDTREGALTTAMILNRCLRCTDIMFDLLSAISRQTWKSFNQWDTTQLKTDLCLWDSGTCATNTLFAVPQIYIRIIAAGNNHSYQNMLQFWRTCHKTVMEVARLCITLKIYHKTKQELDCSLKVQFSKTLKHTLKILCWIKASFTNIEIA